MSYDIKKHFPYAEIREQQSLAILYALRNFLQHDKRFVIVDAAMNDFIRPTLYDAFHSIVTLAPPQNAIGKADIVGPVCETGDYLGLDRDMPALASGDKLAVLSAGAYGAVMASAYNTRPPAGEVLVHDGKAHLLRPARSIASLLAEELIPALE